MRWCPLVLALGCGGGNAAMSDGSNHGGGDGNGGGGDGSQQMGVDAAPALCGDGLRVRGEECDDHNTNDGDGCDSTCHVEGPTGPAGDAMRAVNAIRALADDPGVPVQSCTQAKSSSQAHAEYYANNAQAYAGGLSPHNEDANFPNGFTGVNFFDRMSTQGCAGNPMFETMAFVGDPASAVDEWLNTVFHRIPILHPNLGSFNYGLSTANGRNNDVADYASGNAADPNAIIVWPPPNATNISGSFDTRFEGPTPPSPPGGGTTTGPLISVFFANSGGTITSHAIKDGGGNTLPDTMIAPNDGSFGAFMMGSYCFYAAGPAAPGSHFTIEIAGTVNGQAFSTSWSFTTQ